MCFAVIYTTIREFYTKVNLLKPTGYVMHQQFNLSKPTGYVMHQQFNLLKPTGYVMHQQFNLNIINTTFFCLHSHRIRCMSSLG